MSRLTPEYSAASATVNQDFMLTSAPVSPRAETRVGEGARVSGSHHGEGANRVGRAADARRRGCSIVSENTLGRADRWSARPFTARMAGMVPSI
ncbi:MAG TPA: hypothetical protein VKE51_21975, partial [Vicinamibacterales bacterium]|nr:hypothetical protein [Vicinamibacterales bacterium]